VHFKWSEEFSKIPTNINTQKYCTEKQLAIQEFRHTIPPFMDGTGKVSILVGYHWFYAHTRDGRRG
jgi:hypothetical protein